MPSVRAAASSQINRFLAEGRPSRKRPNDAAWVGLELLDQMTAEFSYCRNPIHFLKRANRWKKLLRTMHDRPAELKQWGGLWKPYAATSYFEPAPMLSWTGHICRPVQS